MSKGNLSDGVWADVLAHVRLHQPGAARGWFSQLRAGRLEGGVLSVVAANGAQLGYLHRHCMRAFSEAAQAATGRLVSVRFESTAGEQADPAGERFAQACAALAAGNGAALPLNAENTFSNFVEGPCNRLALASCIGVSQGPGTGYNPLFIYGGAGLGKTHLVQAVCHDLLERSPGTRVFYLSSETFVNQFIESVERGALADFRYLYRNADVLIIEDIQFISGHERTQEEFFHTFNALHQAQKHIVLTADCAPAEIRGLEERLTSRFKWGLVARLDPPCLDTRIAIIQKKARLRGVLIPDEVAHHIASSCTANARELEGALTRLHKTAEVEERRIDVGLSRRVLGSEERSLQRTIRMQDIMSAVGDRFDVRLGELQGRRKSRSVTRPRQVSMYLARRLTSHTLGEIGGFFGGRDHTTVLHALKTVESHRIRDEAFRKQLDDLELALRQHATHRSL